MKVTLEIIARDLAIKFPEIIKTPAFIALSKLGSLRSTKDLGVDLEMLQKDYKLAMLPEKATSKAPVEETTRQPEPPAAVQAAPIAQAASASPDVSLQAAVEVGVASLCSLCKTFHKYGVSCPPGSVIKGEKGELPAFLKEALKGIK